MGIFKAISRAGFGALAEEGQERLARFAYEVHRIATGDRKEWLDLTQREQMRWIGAAGDCIERWLS